MSSTQVGGRICNVKHLEKVFSNARQKSSRPEGDEMMDVEVNGMIWRIFMSASMKAAVHLGPDYKENLRTTKNTDFEQVKTLFHISQSLILNHQSEFYVISTIEWNTTPWMRSNLLLRDRAIKLSKAKVHVYSDPVLCLGKIHEHPVFTEVERTNSMVMNGNWLARLGITRVII